MNDHSRSKIVLGEITVLNRLPSDETGDRLVALAPGFPDRPLEIRILNEKTVSLVREIGLETAFQTLLDDLEDSPFPVVDYDLNGPEPFVACRRFEGPSLLEILKNRKTLSMPECGIILSQIAAALEAFRSICPFQPLLVSLDQLRIRENGLQGDLDLQPRIRAGAVFEVDLIRILLNSWQRHSQLPLTIHLAELACWLVGHPQATRPGDRVPRFSPVPELTLEQNQVIKAVLEESDWNAMLPPGNFIQRLTGCPFDVPLTFRLKPAESRLSLVPAWDQGAWGIGGKRFRLTNVRDGETQLITVNGDERVTIGRSTDCDFVAQFRPRNLMNDSRTRQISRRQMELALDSHGIFVRHRGSEENSQIDGRPLKGQVSISPLDQCRLTMAEDYQARVRLFPSAFRLPIEIADVTAIEGRNAPIGAAGITPDFDLALVNQVWWVLTDLSMTMTAAGVLRPVDPQEGWNVVVRFHYFLDRLWIERCGRVPVTVGGRELAVRQLAPLAAERILGIGELTFGIQEFVRVEEEHPGSA